MGGGNVPLGRKCTNYNEINNNSENFRGGKIAVGERGFIP